MRFAGMRLEDALKSLHEENEEMYVCITDWDDEQWRFNGRTCSYPMDLMNRWCKYYSSLIEADGLDIVEGQPCYWLQIKTYKNTPLIDLLTKLSLSDEYSHLWVTVQQDMPNDEIRDIISEGLTPQQTISAISYYEPELINSKIANFAVFDTDFVIKYMIDRINILIK